MKIKSIKRVVYDTPKPFYDVINANPYNNFLVKTGDVYICSHNCVYANFTDEVNFGLTNDVEKLKAKQKQLISQIDARMKSRFIRGTYLPTLNIIASSKNSDQSFLDSYIETKRKNESSTTLIVDEPQWVVDSRKDNPIHFYVAIGNKYLSNELLPRDATEELAEEYRAKGYSIMEVPIGYYENFQDNIDGALTDIAGISSTSGMKYISGMRWNEIKSDSYKNPFTKDIIEVGIGDDVQYSDFFDLSLVDNELKSKPLYIHLDMSQGSGGKGDKTGIAGTWVVGKKPKVEGEDSSRELFYQLAFGVSIKAPKGREISFDKNRAFIRWLREHGFNIHSISCDTFQSAQIKQQLSADGFNVDTISVDRLDSQTKQCLPYAYFKSTIYDKRFKVFQKCDLLTDEVIGLEREGDGHINHPDNGKSGSKDLVDAVCGSIWNASQHAEEFAYNYGEDLNLMFDTDSMSNRTQEQLTVDFENELKNLSPIAQSIKQNQKNNDQMNDWLDIQDGILML